MSVFSNQFRRAIDLRFDLMLNLIFRKYELEPHLEESEIETEAYILGSVYPYSDAVREVFAETPLQDAYMSGYKDAEDYRKEAEAIRDEIEESFGSEDEWDALSPEEQDELWDEFHDLCAIGTADTMYFYQVMSNQHMVNYVGH